MLNSISWKVKYGFVAIVIGIIMLIMSVPKFISFMSDPIKVDSPQKARSLKSGDHVTIDINMADGYYMTYTEDGKETARYYIAYFYDMALDDDNNVIAFDEYGLTVRVGKNYYTNMDNATNALDTFFANLETDITTPAPTQVYLTIDGVIEEFSKSDEKKYAKEFVDYGYIDYVYVVPNAKSSTNIIMIIGFVFVGVGILLFVLYFIGKKKDDARLAELQASNPGYYQAPGDVTFDNNQVDPRFARLAGSNSLNNNVPTGNMNFNEVSSDQGNSNTISFNDVPSGQDLPNTVSFNDVPSGQDLPNIVSINDISSGQGNNNTDNGF